MESIRLFICALLLSPVVALAQAEEAEGATEEPAVEEVPAEEAAPADAAPAEGAPADEAAPAEEAAAEEAPAESEEPAQVWEGEGTGFVDVYYVPTTNASIPGGLDEYGDGMGARAQYQFWKFVAVTAEYNTRTFDDIDADINDQRLGLGAALRNSNGDTAGLFLQYEKYEVDDSDSDGFGLHGRMSHVVNDWFEYYGDLGYLRLEDDVEKYTGIEFTAGLMFKVGRFGVFADWRHQTLEGKDSGVRPSLEDVRVGARLNFGGGSSDSDAATGGE